MLNSSLGFINSEVILISPRRSWKGRTRQKTSGSVTWTRHYGARAGVTVPRSPRNKTHNNLRSVKLSEPELPDI